MRLRSDQIQTIKTVVHRVLGEPCQIWLFGSRVDDHRRGGDIDLMIETEATLPNRAMGICQLYAALIVALGDQKLDLVLKDAKTNDAPIFEIARRTGVLL